MKGKEKTREEFIAMIRELIAELPESDPAYQFFDYLTGDWADGRGDDETLEQKAQAFREAVEES